MKTAIPKNRRSIQVWCGPLINAAFDVFEPESGVITIGGIAHALALQCRFNGHCSRFYSVAEHCIHVSLLMERRRKSGLVGLLHDASEAFLADIPAPVKYTGLFDGYLELEDRLQSAIYDRFDVTVEAFDQVDDLTACDLMALATERRFLMQPVVEDIWKDIGPWDDETMDLKGWPPSIIEHDFVRRFEQLSQ